MSSKSSQAVGALTVPDALVRVALRREGADRIIDTVGRGASDRMDRFESTVTGGGAMSISRLMRAGQPLVLLFAVFATLVSAADLWLGLLGPERIKAALIAYTGWVPSSTYLFAAIMAWLLVATGDRRRVMRLWLVVPLLIGVVSGYRSYASRGEDFGNPYLRVSRWQPVWTMLIPTVWAALLLLPPGPVRPPRRPTRVEGAVDDFGSTDVAHPIP